ncbi:MAG: hypothetical protein Q9M28_10620 [Mariprofundaceae bacterium]|nr:hypothetical protein [Mariprofundaceae bacterium]
MTVTLFLLMVQATFHPKIFIVTSAVKKHRNGSTTDYHQMLGAVLIHPDSRCVLPFAPEAILKQDGIKKNDCERNAARRLLHDLRREHPHMKLTIIEDGLASNAPHIKTLKELNMNFILGAKKVIMPIFLTKLIKVMLLGMKQQTKKENTIAFDSLTKSP